MHLLTPLQLQSLVRMRHAQREVQALRKELEAGAMATALAELRVTAQAFAKRWVGRVRVLS